MAKVGIFFGTSTGNTQVVAEKIYEAFGSDLAAEPVDVDSLSGEVAAAFSGHDTLVVGSPTWNTGMDTERSGTGWDEIYYTQLPDLRDTLKDKKVAVFGLGDQISYGENYADAAGELYDVFEGLGCRMMGQWAIDESYEHEASKSIRGDKFCGLLLDMINQEELTEERVNTWVQQLKEDGFVDNSDSTSNAPSVSESKIVAEDTAVENIVVKDTVDEETLVEETIAVAVDSVMPELELGTKLMNQSIGVHSTGGYTPHYNPIRKETMWTSPDGRTSFVTADAQTDVETGLQP